MKIIIFYDEGKIYTKSTAILKIAGYIGAPYSAVSVLQAFPLSWRDNIYEMIARNRSGWFGTKDQCVVPDKETMNRIIA
jgi:predicted DCC family thiol-disulfide oxidoreductase YuxK